MKTPLLSICFLFLLFTLHAQDSKKTVFGIKGGMNVSIFSASINSESGFKTGANFGCYVKTPISRSAFFRPEIYYSSQGEKDDYQDNLGNSHGSTTTTLNCLNVPVLFDWAES